VVDVDLLTEQVAQNLRVRTVARTSVPSVAKRSPSKSNDQNAKPRLLNALLVAESAGFSVRVGDQELTGSESALQLGELVANACVDNTATWSSCDLPLTRESPNNDDAQLGEVLMRCIGATDEATVQKALASWLLQHHGLDTSPGQQCGFPTFLPKEMLSRPNGSDAEAFRATGKPDGLALTVPLSLEIKTQKKTKTDVYAPTDEDALVLKQAVERVVPMLQVFGYLRLSVSIASTGRCSWLVVASRKSSGEPDGMTVKITRFETALAGRLWRELCGKGLGFFLTSDAALITRALMRAGMQPAACRVKFVAASMSTVYKVTLATSFLTPSASASSQRTCLAVVGHGEEALAIKVVRNNEHFRTEANVLKALAAQDRTGSFYGLGCVPAADDADTGGIY
jgi:hypothetical protein